jgi:hypothetical protein
MSVTADSLKDKTVRPSAIWGAEPGLDGISKVPLVPIRNRQFGPLVLRRRWRTFSIWAAVLTTCWFLLSQNLSVSANAFALSAMVPGAGFLYAGGIVGITLAVVAFVALPASMINWFASGNMTGVLLAWFGGAGLAAWYAAYFATGPSVGVATYTPFVALGVVALWTMIVRLNFRRGVAAARATNEVIASIQTPLLREFPAVSAEPELNEHELLIARATFDKALQPLNQWDGFELDVEQWQLMATRYVLYQATTSIANVHYLHTPSFTGYARAGMENLILKNLDKRIWSFWFWENLWGNFDANPDPIRRDNIMITGFLSTHIGLFETLFQDQRFDRESALVWRWSDKKQFRYSYSQMIAALMHNYGRYDVSWMPCEPNLIYSMCNINGFNALQIYDRLRGTNNWERIRARVERSFEEEFMHADGRVVCLLFNRIGLQAPTLSSVVGESSGIPGLMAMWPEKAERLWHVMKRKFLKRQPDGSYEIKMVDFGWDNWDATNIGGAVTTIKRAQQQRARFLLMQAAVQIGDTEVAHALSTQLDAQFGVGTAMAIQLGHGKAALRNLVLKGMPEAWRTGPVLEEARYPDVLVARAVSDGRALELVIRPGSGAKPVRLGFDRLLPAKRYTVSGADTGEIVADSLGRASLVVNLHDRQEVRIVPRH